MSSSPSRDSRSRFSSPDNETAAEQFDRELKESMRSSPIPDPDEPPTLGAGGAPGTPTPLSSASRAVTNCYRNETAAIRRAATQAKLHPYQRDAAIDVLTQAPNVRDALIFVRICETDNKLDRILAAAPAFVVSDALKESINSYALAVLLSPKISVYKGNLLRDHVIAVLKKIRTHVPDNADADPVIWTTIYTQVKYALTQTWSDIKQKIRDSKSKQGSTLSIYELATKVVGASNCAVSIPLCSRLALLRCVHVIDSSAKFWDSVDKRLVQIRTAANMKASKIHRALEDILAKDRKTYGVASGHVVKDSSAAWQQSVDETVEVQEQASIENAAGDGEDGEDGEEMA